MLDERIARMAEKSNAVDIYPEKCVPTYDRLYMLQPELIGDAMRTAQYLKAQPVKITDDDLFVGLIKFDASIRGDLFKRVGFRHYSELAERYYKQPLENLFTRDHQHATGNFGHIIQVGLSGLMQEIKESRMAHDGEPEKMEYLDAIQIVLQGIMDWEEKCALACEEAASQAAAGMRRTELAEMARILHRVPLQPASTFREGIQSLYFCFQFVPDSIGTADRYLLPLYRQDITNGTLTREEAKVYIQELYVMINGHTTPCNPWAADKGGESHFCIGGYTEDREDGYTELSQLMLEALMEIPTYRPEISLRWTDKTPREALRYVLNCERNDFYKRVALCSDVPRIQALTEKLGFDFKDAITYTMVGCNEPATQGGINFGAGNANAACCLDRLLYDFADDVLAAKSFDEFYALFEREFAKDAERIVEINNAFNRYYSLDVDIMSSLFMDGPILKGKSLSNGGARLGFNGISLMGTGTVVDSLIVIRQFVYEEKVFTMQQMLDMLHANWEGYEKEHRFIYRTAKYYGNDDPFSNQMAQRYTRTINDLFGTKRDLFGFPYLMGNLMGYCSHHAWFGKQLRATPDGRFAGEPLSFGSGQSGGRDRNGLVPLLNAVAKRDPTGIMCGPSVLNVMLDEALIRDDEKFERTVDMIDAYFRSGGLHIQLNYVSREELEAARREPEKHENLRVRVSGFSGYFTLLAEDIQQEIIDRTQKDG